MAKFIFSWNNLKYSIKKKGEYLWKRNRNEETIIINDVSGVAFSESVIAIMGVSGCGKTTLLTLLSGQRHGKGVLKINDKIISRKLLRSNSIFLQQNDFFIETLTIYEHIQFMAAMYLQKPFRLRMSIIRELLLNLNLENIKYTKLKCLSSGEKRRVSLAASLLAEPYILFCDEPITGLDSSSAMSVVKMFETIAASGKIVFMTVHQPSSELFQSFDNIILLASNGKVAFQGSKDNAKKFFESQGLYCPAAFNLADFYIKNMIVNSSTDSKRIESMIEVFNRDYVLKLDFANGEYDGVLLRERSSSGNGELKSFFSALGWLIWRVYIDLSRRVKHYFTIFLLIMLTAFIIGLSYSGTNIKDMTAVQSIQGALLLIVSEIIFNQMYQVIYTFPAEIEIFVQEKSLYSALPYFLSKFFSLIPFGILHSFGFLVFYFLLLPFVKGIKLFLSMCLVLFGAALTGSSFGLCLSALFPSVESIHLFIVPLELVCLLLSGLWIRINSVSQLFSIVKYFSPFYVSYESICILYWMDVGKLMDTCPQIESADLSNATYPCFHTGQDVLISYGFETSYDKVLKNGLYMIVLIATYSYIGYIGIVRKRAVYQI
ncbi:hypothetical protein ABEB36_002476 [Hypothenemus hampei]|uniref:ABC transporter domain-containing protein n=1 Tax=Hypothenemus hampei TaxID=57062 RepID=A0ABD1F5V1_HYPHA